MYCPVVATHTKLTCAASAIVLALLVTPVAAEVRYVSTAGNNNSPCTLAQPCRTLQRGIGQTPAGGELHILDSGFYGNNAAVKKSMTIVGNGHTVTLGAPLTINKANAVVAIRRLTLNGLSNTQRGIDIVAAAKVHVEHCLIYRHTLDGIRLNGSNITLFVSDTTVRDNGQNGLITDGGGTATLVVDNSRFENNTAHGLFAIGAEASITRSFAGSNGAVGFIVLAGRMSIASTISVQNFSSGFSVSTTAEMTLESAVARGNNIGLLVSSGSTARIAHSTFTNNVIGVSNSGTTETLQNNTIRGNATLNIGGNTLSAVGGS